MPISNTAYLCFEMFFDWVMLFSFSQRLFSCASLNKFINVHKPNVNFIFRSETSLKKKTRSEVKTLLKVLLILVSNYSIYREFK